VKLPFLFHQKALKIYKEYFGEKDLSTLKCYNNLGNIYLYRKDFQNALSLFQRALNGKQEILGENHEDTATGYNNLAGVYNEMEKYDEALPLFQKALDIRKNILGENHHNTTESYDNLAWLYIETKNYNEALVLLKKALKIRKNIFGKNHHILVKNLYKIAECYHEIGELIEAIAFYKKALTIGKETLGATDDMVLTINNNLGMTYQTIGSIEKAIPIFLNNLAIFHNKEQKNFIEIGRCHHNLGVCYYDNYESQEAYKYMTESVKIREKYLPSNHPDLIQSKKYLIIFEEDVKMSYKEKRMEEFKAYIINKIRNGQKINFDKDATGKTPIRWNEGITGAGNYKWRVAKDSSAPSVPNVLLQSAYGSFPWCVLQSAKLQTFYWQSD